MPAQPNAPTAKPAVPTKYLGPVATVFKASPTGSWRDVRPELVKERCIACGICAQHCPLDVITVGKEEFHIDYTYCKGCGICANVCPKGALTLQPERREG